MGNRFDCAIVAAGALPRCEIHHPLAAYPDFFDVLVGLPGAGSNESENTVIQTVEGSRANRAARVSKRICDSQTVRAQNG